jgi:chromosome segregation ATPase
LLTLAIDLKLLTQIKFERMKRYFAYFLVLGALLGSCKDAEKEGYLAEINQMENQLDSLWSEIEENNMDSLKGITSTISTVIDKVQKNYFPDSVDLEIAGKMNLYKGVKKSLERNSGNLAKAKAAIPEIKETLSNLKHDIENGAGNREQYADNVAYEQDKVNQVNELLSFYFSAREESLATFQEVHPIIEKFANELEEKRQQEVNEE